MTSLLLIPGIAGAGESRDRDIELAEPTNAPVVGGTSSPAGKWPDVAAVRFDGQQGCTGTLIAPTVVLTAGHCIASDLDSVLIGTSSLARPQEGEVISVIDRIEYPSSSSSYDLGVLILAYPATHSPRPIASGWARFDIKNNAQVAIVGYGAIDADSTTFVNELQEATTTITDADCEVSAGCNAQARPSGELGAGGSNVDTCAGDSGGPLYLTTGYGTFLAGVTSRAYDNALSPCGEGGLYTRPDKVIDWIEQASGVEVARGPEPTFDAMSAVRGHAAETTLDPNDPKTNDHSFTITTQPGHGTAVVRGDGRVRVCTDADATGVDSMVVTIADKAQPERAIAVNIPITIGEGMPAGDCDPEAFEDGGGGGCCDSGHGSAATLPMAALVLLLLVRRRRHAIA
ncbi:MAG: trypsin-like serine protease [Kofleriaceae bacterium]